jgi:hypothetical protein
MPARSYIMGSPTVFPTRAQQLNDGGTSQPPFLPPPAMRKALSELILGARTRRPSDAVVSKTAQNLVTMAKRDGLRAEQLIVTLKKEWVEITGPKRAATDDGLRETQERLISECIRTFYQ